MNSPNAIFCPVDVTKSEDVAAALEETKVLMKRDGEVISGSFRESLED